MAEERMQISKFKATCLAVLERVRRTGQPLTVTKRGEPIARVVPIEPPQSKRKSTYGAMKGRGREIEDIVEPLPPEDWGSLY